MASRKLLGRVLKIVADKTVSVMVQRVYTHGLYKKTLREYKKYLVHDSANTSRVGDSVYIIESRPISKMKRWKIFSVDS